MMQKKQFKSKVIDILDKRLPKSIPSVVIEEIIGDICSIIDRQSTLSILRISTDYLSIPQTDPEYKKMELIKNLCIAGGVSVPPEVQSYFDDIPCDGIRKPILCDYEEYLHDGVRKITVKIKKEFFDKMTSDSESIREFNGIEVTAQIVGGIMNDWKTYSIDDDNPSSPGKVK